MNSKVRQRLPLRTKSLFAKLDQGGRTNFIEEVIVLDHDPLGLCPPRHPTQSLELMKDLDDAIDFGREALELCPAGQPHRCASLNNLVVFLCTRYDQQGVTKDLDDATALAREAVELCPPGQINRSQSLNNLAVGLSARYNHLGDTRDLDEAIVFGREALELHPLGHSRRSQSMNNLAVDLSTRYEQLGAMTDLVEVIALDREALGLLPHGHPHRSTSLNNLAAGVFTQYKQLGEMMDLEEVIVLDREALELHPPAHSDRLQSLSNLAGSLFTRYEQLGTIEDLNEAIVLEREALELRPPGHPDRLQSLSALEVHLSTRFKQLGAMEDLEEAVVLGRDALTICPPGHPDRSSSLINLAVHLSIRYQQLGAMEDLDEAIVLEREALELRPPEHLDRSSSLIHLALDISTRYRQLGAMEDLEEAVVLGRDALTLCPPGHPDRSSSMIQLAIRLSTRYKQLGAIEDLSETIVLEREALALRSPGHPLRPISLNILANDLSTRYEQLGAMEDLNEAIVLGREVLELRTPGHPHRSDALMNLTRFLRARSTQSSQSSDEEELFALYTELAHAPQMVSPTDLSTAREWIRAAEDFQHPTTSLAYETYLQSLIHHLATLPPSLHLTVTENFTSDAFSACLREHAPNRAVELLEQGWGVFWNQLTHLHSPLDDVVASGPAGKQLADEFTRLASLIRNDLGSPDADRVCRLNVELERVVTSIRDLPGLSRFLLPSLFSDLRCAASGGPVIIVNASQYSCDALVVLLDQDPVHIPLKMTRGGARELSSKLHALIVRAKRGDVTREFALILRELWDEVVSPIVDFLQTTHPSQSRIWWCPTAEFSLLPFHAAGPYSKDRQNLSDVYISSYTPTLTALIHARRPGPSNSAAEGKQFVAIGHAKDIGNSELLSVGTELAGIAQRVDGLATFTRIEDPESCISRVSEELSKTQWVHLACHGLRNRKAPFGSGFALYDGLFTIEHIIRCELENPEFAYLSTSDTTVGDQSPDEESPDEAIHLASAMQFIGFRSVVGPMWAVDDSKTNEITSMFYHNMVDESGRLDHTRAAFALHKTMKELVDLPFYQRIMYIHLGA